ncbi:MAG: redoxin domain-containing protein [Candidatus Lernaella stagnicola]|nr:redoxin domain-containing protein [Candidatus Lernaella stagnicola]
MRKKHFVFPTLIAVVLFAVGAWPAGAVDFEAKGPSRGPAEAPVQLVEFFDFQCAHCAKLSPVLDVLVKDYGDLIRIVAMPINTPGHAYSEPAAELALTAADQGKFWEAYKEIFANQSELDDEYLAMLAEKLGIDKAEYAANQESHKHRSILRANFMLAVDDLELEVTPTVFLNGTRFEGNKSPDFYRYYINQELKKKNIASPVGDVPEPADKASAQVGRVPLELIFPVERMKPVDSQLKVKVGGRAPDFELPTTRMGVNVKLSQFRGDKNVVLSFVPAAWTPQCSAQWPEYNEYEEEFEELNTMVIGISADNVPSLYSWVTSMGRPWFVVASDFWPHGKVADSYGVFRPNGVTERAVFVIDTKGIIRFIDVHDINGRPSIKRTLEELRKLEQ